MPGLSAPAPSQTVPPTTEPGTTLMRYRLAHGAEAATPADREKTMPRIRPAKVGNQRRGERAVDIIRHLVPRQGRRCAAGRGVTGNRAMGVPRTTGDSREKQPIKLGSDRVYQPGLACAEDDPAGWVTNLRM